MSGKTARSASPLGLVILVAVLLFGAVQLYFWTDRSIWIDEISQLINFPLDNLAQAFGPLPEAQQAGPPLFNLLMHSISTLPIRTMRVLLIALTLCAVLAALVGAFGKRPLLIAVGLFVLLSHQSFLINASMLKFYTFDLAGFAIFSAWIYAKDPGDAFGLRDVAVILLGLVLGVSTIVGACIVVAVFLAMRLVHRQISASEIVLGGIVAVIAFGYYVQLSHAVEIQITGFPDTYGRLGTEAVMKFFEAASDLLQRRGLAILIVLLAIALVAIVLLARQEQAGLARLLLFTAVVSSVFLGLAAIGKYPAVSSRHLVWILGIFPVLAGAVVGCLQFPGTHIRRIFALSSMTLLTFVLVGTGLRVVMKWPPQIVEGASDQIVSALAELPPSDVLHYFGSFRLIPLMLEKGAPITHHTYAPALSTKSGSIVSTYFGTDWNSMDEDLFSQHIEEMLRNDPIGWAKMYVLLRARGDFRPLARFVLDAAPADGRTFYVTSIHASWPGLPGRATAGLRNVLDERSCEYAPLATFDTLLSPGYILQIRCPRNERDL